MTRCARPCVCAALTAILGAAAGGTAARAGFIPDGIKPNPMDILCDGEKLGSLEITNY